MSQKTKEKKLLYELYIEQKDGKIEVKRFSFTEKEYKEYLKENNLKQVNPKD